MLSNGARPACVQRARDRCVYRAQQKGACPYPCDDMEPTTGSVLAEDTTHNRRKLLGRTPKEAQTWSTIGPWRSAPEGTCATCAEKSDNWGEVESELGIEWPSPDRGSTVTSPGRRMVRGFDHLCLLRDLSWWLATQELAGGGGGRGADAQKQVSFFGCPC